MSNNDYLTPPGVSNREVCEIREENAKLKSELEQYQKTLKLVVSTLKKYQNNFDILLLDTLESKLKTAVLQSGNFNKNRYGGYYS